MPQRGPRPVGHHRVPPLQVLDGPRGDEREPHPLAGGRRHVRHGIPQGRIVLHIIQAGKGAHPIAKGGMRGHILHLLPINVDFSGAFAQPRNVFLSCPGWHGFSLLLLTFE